MHPINKLQSEYSFWSCDIDEDILPILRELGIGVGSETNKLHILKTGTLGSVAVFRFLSLLFLQYPTRKPQRSVSASGRATAGIILPIPPPSRTVHRSLLGLGVIYQPPAIFRN
jgi:hypothetical protein